MVLISTGFFAALTMGILLFIQRISEKDTENSVERNREGTKVKT